MNNKDNYFERTRKRLHSKKYQYYFFDYLYYKGERWSEKNLRCSGSFMIWWFWWLNITIPASFMTSHWWNNPVRYSIDIALFIFPIVFTMTRYRKERKTAVMGHYRRSKNSGFTIFLLFVLSFAILFAEMWLLEQVGFVCRGKFFM